jgi:hypothetical protein
MKCFEAKTALAAAMLVLFAAPAQAQDTAYCTVPGELVSEDASGDAGAQGAPDPVEAHDVEAVYIAEPAGTNKLVITLKVKTLSPEPVPNSIYYTSFMLDDEREYFVVFRPYVLPDPTPNQIQFGYGHLEPDTTGATGGTLVTDGPVEGSFDADGFITWTVDSTLIPALATTVDMFSIVGEARVIAGSPFAHPAQPPPPAPRVPSGFVVIVDESPAGFYTLRGGASCAGAGKSGSGLVAGGMPAGLLLLLTLAGWARRRL